MSDGKRPKRNDPARIQRDFRNFVAAQQQMMSPNYGEHLGGLMKSDQDPDRKISRDQIPDDTAKKVLEAIEPIVVMSQAEQVATDHLDAFQNINVQIEDGGVEFPDRAESAAVESRPESGVEFADQEASKQAVTEVVERQSVVEDQPAPRVVDIPDQEEEPSRSIEPPPPIEPVESSPPPIDAIPPVQPDPIVVGPEPLVPQDDDVEPPQTPPVELEPPAVAEPLFGPSERPLDDQPDLTPVPSGPVEFPEPEPVVGMPIGMPDSPVDDIADTGVPQQLPPEPAAIPPAAEPIPPAVEPVAPAVPDVPPIDVGPAEVPPAPVEIPERLPVGEFVDVLPDQPFLPVQEPERVEEFRTSHVPLEQNVFDTLPPIDVFQEPSFQEPMAFAVPEEKVDVREEIRAWSVSEDVQPEPLIVPPEAPADEPEQPVAQEPPQPPPEPEPQRQPPPPLLDEQGRAIPPPRERSMWTRQADPVVSHDDTLGVSPPPSSPVVQATGAMGVSSIFDDEAVVLRDPVGTLVDRDFTGGEISALDAYRDMESGIDRYTLTMTEVMRNITSGLLRRADEAHLMKDALTSEGVDDYL